MPLRLKRHLASLIRNYTGNRSSQLLDIAARDLRKGKWSELNSINLEKYGGGLNAQRLAICLCHHKVLTCLFPEFQKHTFNLLLIFLFPPVGPGWGGGWKGGGQEADWESGFVCNIYIVNYILITWWFHWLSLDGIACCAQHKCAYTCIMASKLQYQYARGFSINPI